MECVTGISSGIDCEGTQGFLVSFSFSFARPHGAGSVSMLVEIVFGNGRDLNKSLMFGWKTFFRGEDGGSFKWSPLDLRFLFSSYSPSRISNIQKDKVVLLKSYI